MPSSLHAASSLARIACPPSRRRKRIDSLTGNRGLGPPTPFQRIDITVQTTPTRIASGLGYTPGNRIAVAIGKPSDGPVHPGKTTPAFIVSGPGYTLDNR